jgi:hypothetical protein
MLPICVKCHVFLRPKKNGFYFLEGMPLGRAKPGLVEADRWVPYKLWVGDLHECPQCGIQVIAGVPHNRIAEHYEVDFSALTTKLGAEQFQVNDCC